MELLLVHMNYCKPLIFFTYECPLDYYKPTWKNYYDFPKFLQTWLPQRMEWSHTNTYRHNKIWQSVSPTSSNTRFTICNQGTDPKIFQSTWRIIQSIFWLLFRVLEMSSRDLLLPGFQRRWCWCHSDFSGKFYLVIANTEEFFKTC